jgi:hypothetical protein
MRITRKNAGSGRQTITVTLDAHDDPASLIANLADSGRLAGFLRVYGRPGDLGGPSSQDEARELLEQLAAVTRRAEDRLEDAQLAARDQWGLGWGAIATAVDLSRSTVKGQIQASRSRCAGDGIWYDAGGRHEKTPAAAHEATGIAWDLDGREPYLDRDDPEYRPCAPQG